MNFESNAEQLATGRLGRCTLEGREREPQGRGVGEL